MEKAITITNDGSNDTGLFKINLITVRMFDISHEKVDMWFLDMCSTTGASSATAGVIFSQMDQMMLYCEVPWINYVGVGVDNTSVNLSKHNCVKLKVQQANPDIYFMGCACHIAHNTANATTNSFNHATGFDVEEMALDFLL